MTNELEKKVLPICSACKDIKIAENMWLERKIHPEIYDEFMKKYKRKLSHSCCPKCIGEYSK